MMVDLRQMILKPRPLPSFPSARGLYPPCMGLLVLAAQPLTYGALLCASKFFMTVAVARLRVWAGRVVIRPTVLKFV